MLVDLKALVSEFVAALRVVPLSAGAFARRRPLLILPFGTIAWVAAIKALAPLWDWVVFDLAGLDARSRLGDSVRFFLYDSTKIALLLAGIVFAVSLLRSFMSLERTRAPLGGRREGVGNVAAAGLGVATPFCSCSAVPAFIGFVRPAFRSGSRCRF